MNPANKYFKNKPFFYLFARLNRQLYKNTVMFIQNSYY